MQTKKLYIILAVVVVVVAAAAFIGGRLLNGQAGPLGVFPMGGGGNTSFRIDMTPAPELPKTEPEARGSFVERRDNTIVIQTVSMEMGKGGVVVSIGSGGEGGGGPITNQDGGEQGPKVEVVITNETVIYHDATEMPSPSEANESMIVQQTVEEGTLDDLTSDSMVMVWGRKNGDRIIADMILYTQPVVFMKGAP